MQRPALQGLLSLLSSTIQEHLFRVAAPTVHGPFISIINQENLLQVCCLQSNFMEVLSQLRASLPRPVWCLTPLIPTFRKQRQVDL